MYGMPEPIKCLNSEPPPKQYYKDLYTKKIISFHEKEWRTKAESNCKVKYFNVSILGLTGRCHPSILFASTSNEVRKIRSHSQMLTEDYYTMSRQAEWKKTSPNCLLCLSEDKNKCIPETTSHIIGTCSSLNSSLEIILTQIKDLCYSNFSHIQFSDLTSAHSAQ